MTTAVLLAILMLAEAAPAQRPAAADAPFPCLDEWKTGKFGRWNPVFAADCKDARKKDWAAIIEEASQGIRDGREFLREATEPEVRRGLAEAVEAWENALALAKRELARVRAVAAGQPDPEAKPEPPPAGNPGAGNRPAAGPGLQGQPGFSTTSPAGIHEPHFKPLELSAIQREFSRQEKLNQTVAMLKADDAAGPGRPAAAYRAGRAACENPRQPLDARLVAALSPLYTLATATNKYWERLFPDALGKFATMQHFLRSFDRRAGRPAGSLERMLAGRAWVNNEATLKQSYWGYKGLLHCDQSQPR